MYKKILAPLDGSKLAECSLEHVKAIASGCNVPEVVLLRVVEPIPAQTAAALAEAGADFLVQAERRNRTDAETYISEVTAMLKKEGLAVQGALARGNAAEEILDYAKKNHVDLIIMSTHGRSGVTRWVFGSVADRLLRHSTVPVLVVSPAGCRD